MTLTFATAHVYVIVFGEMYMSKNIFLNQIRQLKYVHKYLFLRRVTIRRAREEKKNPDKTKIWLIVIYCRTGKGEKNERMKNENR